MAITNLPSAAGSKSLEDVINAVEKMRKETEFLLANIESDNIRGQIAPEKLTLDFSIDSHEPYFIDNTDILVESYWFKGFNYNWANVNYYSYKHAGRYLKVVLAIKADAGTSGWARIVLGSSTEVWRYSTTESAGGGEYVTATIDLGTPDNALRSFYIQLATGDSSGAKAGYVRVLKKWIEG